jgi:outer membrane protein OmpA-like peptidoglycan-associated protein
MPMKSRLLVAALAALSLSACTSINPFTGEQQVSNTTGGALIGAGSGAVVGGLLGVATGNDPRVGALLGAGIGGLSGAMIGKYQDQQEAELRQQLLGTGVSVTRVGQQIILNMPSNITFDVDSDRINPEFNETLISVGLVLKKFNKTVVDVYGYTDSTGSDTYNLELSPKRATSVATVLASQGVDQRRFYITGRGEADPVASNATDAGRSQNRRVEIQLSPIEG